MAAALELFERLEQRFEIAAFIDELRVLLIEHLLQRLDLVDHHAEDRGDGSLAWEVSIFVSRIWRRSRSIKIFRVALVQHGKVFLRRRLDRQTFASTEWPSE